MITHGHLDRLALEMLSQFLAPRRVEGIEQSVLWKIVTDGDPGRIVDALTVSGLLVDASFAQAIEATFTVLELRDFLRARKMKTSGRKAELAQRLANASSENLGEIQRVVAGRVLVCSDQGKEAATAHRARKADARREAEDSSLSALRSHAFEDAVRIVADFKANMLFPEGLGVDWNSASFRATLLSDVSQIFALFPGQPRILGDLPAQHFCGLKIASAWMALWGPPTGRRDIFADDYAPTRFDKPTAARMLIYFVRGQKTLAEYRALGLQFVRIMTSEPSCPACACLPSIRYSILSPPELPHEHCTEARGCTCIYTYDPEDFADRFDGDVASLRGMV